MESDAAVHSGQAAPAGTQPAAPRPAADVAVTALYQAHALGLIRLAHIMLGDAAAAEDVAQEAFTGLYRRWAQLSDPAKALPYVRSSILNACRSQLRQLSRRPPGAEQALPPAVSAEAAALSGEDRRAVLRALRRLPDRQREVLVLACCVVTSTCRCPAHPTRTSCTSGRPGSALASSPIQRPITGLTRRASSARPRPARPAKARPGAGRMRGRRGVSGTEDRGG